MPGLYKYGQFAVAAQMGNCAVTTLLVEMAQGLPRSTPLRQEAWRWLQTQKIVRPGRTTLRDIITAAREAALQQVYSLLFDQLAPGQREQIDALLVVPAAPETAACTEIDSPSRSR